MADRFVLPRWQALDAVGTALPGAKLYTYVAGTYTPKPTYTDAALTVAHPNPIVADAAGRFPDIFPEQGLYRLRLETAANVLVWEADDVEGKAAGLNAYLLRDGSLPMTGGLLIAPGDNAGIRIDGNASTWIRQPTSQPDVWEIGTGGAARLTLTNTGVEAHVPLTVPTATADEHAMRWDQREAEVFHIATITSPVQSVVVPLPPVPYAAVIEWHDITLDSNQAWVWNVGFGADFSVNNANTWVTSASSRYIVMGLTFGPSGHTHTPTDIAWVFTHQVSSDSVGFGARTSGCLEITNFSTTSRPQMGIYRAVTQMRDANNALQAMTTLGVCATSNVPLSNVAPITHLRFRWRTNLQMVAGTIRVLAKRLS